MQQTFFISDLHLDKTREDITQCFIIFLEKRAPSAEHLYILGDLFESWIGDDDHTPFNLSIRKALAHTVQQGTPVSFIHGNRDFLIGRGFSRETGVRILPDPFVIDLYGEPTLLSHGDIYCTDDIKYQAFRKKAHNPLLQSIFLMLPKFVRRHVAAKARQKSQQHTSAQHTDIMDVSQDAIEKALLKSGCRHMIHGHTHRPNIHDFMLNDQCVKRIVLGDWYTQGSLLVAHSDGRFSLESL